MHLRRWTDDRFLAQLLSSLGALLPLRHPSALEATAARKRVLELTDGVTVRIFRLIETVAAEAIHSGAESITKESFEAEGLVLPLVAMTRKTEERLRRRAAG